VLTAVVTGSPLQSKYGEQVDRDSAYERLAARLATAAQQPTAPAPRTGRERSEPQKKTHRSRAPRPEKSTAEKVLESTEFRQMARSAAAVVGREIARSIFGTARRRR
jgi:hypothetical protein